ncbi:hypothetical protein B0T09DRAFT_388277, partial [Sordaria sp. MPI-SDFR-AT-0083]
PIVRFIDFGTNSSQPAKLVDRHLAGADRPVYITLSYCWTPETVKSKMTRTNKDSYYEAVPATEWPEIYKDTASLACQLGVRYVWIDSLCIIQDDPMDWAERGGQYISEGKFFGNEFLTPEDGELKSTKSESDLQYEFSDCETKFHTRLPAHMLEAYGTPATPSPCI